MSYSNGFDFDWEEYCNANGLSYYKDTHDMYSLAYRLITASPIITCNYLPEGEVYVLDNAIYFGVGEPTEKEKIKREVRKIFTEDPAMRKWYEYAGLI